MSEPIGQTTTTLLIRLVLAAYPGMGWDGIERTRSAIGDVFGVRRIASELCPVTFPVRLDRQQLVLPHLS